MERIALLSGYATISQPKDTEGIGYELRFEVKKGSTSDDELQHYFKSGELLPFTYKGEALAVSLRSVTERVGGYVYEGTAGFLRPGMGGAGG